MLALSTFVNVPASRRFGPRHNAFSPDEEAEMLKKVGAADLDELMSTAMPVSLRREGLMDLGKYTKGMTESEFLEHFKCGAACLGLYLAVTLPHALLP